MFAMWQVLLTYPDIVIDSITLFDVILTVHRR